MRTTLHASILADLASGEWYCGSAWYASYRPTFSQRISELRAAGTPIESRICHRHDHRSTIHEYRLLREPEQLRMIG